MKVHQLCCIFQYVACQLVKQLLPQQMIHVVMAIILYKIIVPGDYDISNRMLCPCTKQVYFSCFSMTTTRPTVFASNYNDRRTLSMHLKHSYVICTLSYCKRIILHGRGSTEAFSLTLHALSVLNSPALATTVAGVDCFICTTC